MSPAQVHPLGVVRAQHEAPSPVSKTLALGAWRALSPQESCSLERQNLPTIWAESSPAKLNGMTEDCKGGTVRTGGREPGALGGSHVPVPAAPRPAGEGCPPGQ